MEKPATFHSLGVLKPSWKPNYEYVLAFTVKTIVELNTIFNYRSDRFSDHEGSLGLPVARHAPLSLRLKESVPPTDKICL
ncbi:hypothetical protein OUZ56_017608 [Daphnia magna]|uniref:Uncharacterized protein n=1 Tax=Daphnia magna TaxID=35525 RepID=A0ABR0AT77_9CRUS|nr:hypothetical protein OUZ56_017608 [Daphnia magna]